MTGAVGLASQKTPTTPRLDRQSAGVLSCQYLDQIQDWGLLQYRRNGFSFPSHFRSSFACTGFVALVFPIVERKQFVVMCKRCQRNVPAGVKAFPFQSIVVPCPLCGELRRYLPSEVYLGVPHHLVRKQTNMDSTEDHQTGQGERGGSLR